MEVVKDGCKVYCFRTCGQWTLEVGSVPKDSSESYVAFAKFTGQSLVSIRTDIDMAIRQYIFNNDLEERLLNLQRLYTLKILLDELSDLGLDTR